MQNHKITVVGMGEAALACAAVLARKNTVTVVGTAQQAQTLSEGGCPVQEPRLAAFLKTVSLTASAELEQACQGADHVVIALDTKFSPAKKSLNTAPVEQALDTALKAAPAAMVVLRSALPVGSTQTLRVQHLSDRVLVCPCFAQPGQALAEALTPSRIVVGAPKYNQDLVEAAKAFAAILAEAADNEPPVLCMGPDEAEAAKLCADAYHTMRAGFFGEVDSLADARGLHADQIFQAVCLDPAIGAVGSNPAFGVIEPSSRQLEQECGKLPDQRGGLTQQLLSAIAKTGRTRRAFSVDRILSLGGYYESDFAGCGKCAGNPVTVGFYRPALLAQAENYTKAMLQDVMDSLTAQGATLLYWDTTGESDGLFEGCQKAADLAAFHKNCDIIVTAQDSDELEPVAEKVYCRNLSLLG